MNDNGVEIPPEVREVIEKGIELTNILCSIDDARGASKAISIAIAHLLCFRMKNEEAAHDMLNLIIDDIDSAVLTTKHYGCTSWADGTPH
jgi:hypothetical protein